MGSSRGRYLLILLLVSASLCAHVSAAASDTAVLAAERTRRKDPLDGLRYYTGGWNISNRHYLASAGFSAAPVFVLAALWFVAVAAAALVACCCCCCRGGGSNYSYSRRVFALSLVFLIVFTAAAIIGCAVLYDGQRKFNGSTTATLDYVVSEADAAAATMRNFTGLLETAKGAGGGVASLPADVTRTIDDVTQRVNNASDVLAARTASNSRRIRTALGTVRKVLIGVAAVIVIGDTCVAMDEWVAQPQGHTALDDILPCADTAVTTDALRRSEQINSQLVGKLNELVSNVSNRDFNSQQVGPPLNYNQSGPPVWQRFVCRTTTSPGTSTEVCATVGRLTPAMLSQMLTVASVSDGLRQQAPAMRDLASCATVRRAFQTIGERGCPSLRRDSSRVYQALLAAAIAAMLAAAAWVVHSRERRRRRESELFRVSPYRLPIEEKVLLNSPRRPYRRV
nr:unnamed protein product [Digitaria exilis]